MRNTDRPWRKYWPSSIPTDFDVKKSLIEYLEENCSRFSDRIALDFYGFEMTYVELHEAIIGFAQGLLELGMKKGDRIALHMQNCPQFIIAYFGILKAGGVVVCINPMFKHAEIEYEISDSQATVYVGLDYLYPELAKVQDKIPLRNIILTSLRDYLPTQPNAPLPAEAQTARLEFPDTLDFKDMVGRSSGELPETSVVIKEDLALLQYTGGTTGLPKGAMITHHALSMASVGAGYWFQNTESDVYLGVTPFFHIMGMVQMMCAPLLSGGKIVVLSRFTPDAVARAIQDHGCTAWVGATTMLIALLQLPDIQNYNLSSFRYVCSGGSPVTPEIQAMVKERIPDALIVDGYGLTESISQGGVITPLGRFKSGFVGVPHVNDVKIVDLETGLKELPPNKEGEIVICGPVLAKGYWNKPEETRIALRDGCLFTGDIGSMDEEGYLKFSGRSKEMIKCSGFSVFPAEVEGIIYRHPAVAEVAVKGVPDPYRGESPKAFVILKPEFINKMTVSDFIEWCKENMATYKRPREVEFVDELPKSAVGKILRRLL
jgi:acyl-CoA synthetase (AMP-forming)/AMP-acid ligase II